MVKENKGSQNDWPAESVERFISPWNIKKTSTGVPKCDHQGGAECHKPVLNPTPAENVNDKKQNHTAKQKSKKPCRLACQPIPMSDGGSRLKLACSGRTGAHSERGKKSESPVLAPFHD